MWDQVRLRDHAGQAMDNLRADHAPREKKLPVILSIEEAQTTLRQVRLLRYPGRLIAPMVRLFMARRSPYRNAAGRYADPWGAIRAKLGEPLWDRPSG